ncbi:hypothetical protein KBY57_11455 [Cyanobium sp. Aljojuca 7D2]|uniref:hypothetical protein n=1 Tax=Cyanobium sp. Aljojuca 7D2 TaxID=2823698 RepID=UPI0020CC8C2A|nr:hypothetical protein [Cyanobium sp. Aljojuca 7D2]MCP9891664.1 hypothetical protein [Cyanobium sp. Aljojuca 7D2]
MSKQSTAATHLEVDADQAVLEELRQAPSLQDADGAPLWPRVAVDASRPVGKGNPPRGRRSQSHKPRATHMEVETRIAEAQLWVAQRLPLAQMREKAAQNWGITNIKTVSKYLALARQRMVEELISDRRRHQAEQIFALNDCARRAMDAGQFNAAVGAFRVIAEIGGLLRAPIKPPEAKT